MHRCLSVVPVDYNMDRRSFFMAAFAAVSSVAGCLENRAATGDPTDSQDTDGGDDTDMNDSSGSEKPVNGDGCGDDPADSKNDDGHEDIRETHFEVLGDDFEFDISASVTFDSDTVTVRGTIQGTNTCYTAKLDEVTIENRTLLVNVESSEEPDEGEVCGEAIIGIDYKVVIEFDGDPPTEVTVKHDGQHVTTEQSS